MVRLRNGWWGLGFLFNSLAPFRPPLPRGFPYQECGRQDHRAKANSQVNLLTSAATALRTLHRRVGQLEAQLGRWGPFWRATWLLGEGVSGTELWAWKA